MSKSSVARAVVTQTNPAQGVRPLGVTQRNTPRRARVSIGGSTITVIGRSPQ
jgi:hypothetical protein